ncbi:MAG: VanZ family protein [Chitinophagaceae bacterium]|nr:VanZ family protein [Chitinophagaceae bacterium]
MTFLRRDFLWRAAATLYGVTLFYIVFLARRRQGSVLFTRNEWNITPVKTKWHYISNWHALHGSVKYGFIENILGNILLFIPFSFFLFFLLHIRQLKKNLLLSGAASAGIEIVQFITGKGVADIDDVILNMLGAVTGFAVAAFIYSRQKGIPERVH